jgi:quercetin dioxygenase-like cupin family protein
MTFVAAQEDMMSDVVVRFPNDGEALWFLDTLMQVKLSGAATNQNLAVLEQLAPPGSATPMHRHDMTDEHFYVLAGEVEFHGATGVRACPAGCFVSIPRGTDHAFRVTGSAPARLLVISSPARFENFVRAVSSPAPSLALPPEGGPPGPEDIQRVAAIGAQHDVIVVGPPPIEA